MSYPQNILELNQAVETRVARMATGEDTGEYVIKEEYARLEAQFTHFLKVAGATIDANGDLVFSAKGYGDWTCRKGTLRTKEIAAENDRLTSLLATVQECVTKNINEAPMLPVRVDEMTQREIQIFNVGAHFSGMAAFIQDYLSEVATQECFQNRVAPWMQVCFGVEISADTTERNHRFLEEALELVQACGCTREEAHQLVDYVFNRAVGETSQEVGGVMVTLAALCLAQGLDMHDAGETELARIWTKIEQIRAKQAAKPRNSPLPAIEQ